MSRTNDWAYPPWQLGTYVLITAPQDEFDGINPQPHNVSSRTPYCGLGYSCRFVLVATCSGNFRIHKLSISFLTSTIDFLPSTIQCSHFIYRKVPVSIQQRASEGSFLPYPAKSYFNLCPKTLSCPSRIRTRIVSYILVHTCHFLLPQSLARTSLFSLTRHQLLCTPAFAARFESRGSSVSSLPVTMHFPTFVTLAAVLIMQLLCENMAVASRPYHYRRGLDNVKPASELGWKVPLLSGEAHYKASQSM